jgi:thiamine kinase-like enzyme
MSLVDESTQELAKNLLKEAGFKPNIKTLDPIHQGGNNQLYRVKNGTQDFVLKKYFQHPEDKRNRLAAEFSFLEFAYKTTPQFVPKPFAKNELDSTALYEFVSGRKIGSQQNLKPEYIEQAAHFISELNQAKNQDASRLMNASEACFSIQDHLNTIDNRIIELSQTPLFEENFKQVLNQLKTLWARIKEKALNDCTMYQISTTEMLAQDKRVISPSDFGFHNAIIQSNGMIKFIDFEYAGWDDPAKLIGDFFSQVAIPIDLNYLANFLKRGFKNMDFTDLEVNRIKLLLDSYKIKWCCIVLNVFLEKNLSRRLFSNPNLDIAILKNTQLNKASIILEGLTS